MKQAHIVPRCNQAIRILKELQEYTGAGRFVFPSVHTHARPMSENTVNAVLRQTGYDKDTMTGHGFCAIARTILNEVLHVRPDYIEHQFAHAAREPNGKSYNRKVHRVISEPPHENLPLTSRTIILHYGGMMFLKERYRVAARCRLLFKESEVFGLILLRGGLFRDLCPDL
jgi:hypothetical protein